MLEEIERSVGLSVEPSEFSGELANFKEKEDAGARKDGAKALFFAQVIKVLSRDAAANDQEENEGLYIRRVKIIERFGTQEECIQPLRSFLSLIVKTEMKDPVSLCIGTNCQRGTIQAWFDRGLREDPKKGFAARRSFGEAKCLVEEVMD